MGSNYDDVYDRSLRDPEGFWSEAAQEIDWIETWNQVIDAPNAPFCRWFVGGVLNACYNAVDRHMETGRVTSVDACGKSWDGWGMAHEAILNNAPNWGGIYFRS
jgi:hypothetical protein